MSDLEKILILKELLPKAKQNSRQMFNGMFEINGVEVTPELLYNNPSIVQVIVKKFGRKNSEMPW